jgi:hypothetical protein
MTQVPRNKMCDTSHVLISSPITVSFCFVLRREVGPVAVVTFCGYNNTTVSCTPYIFDTVQSPHEAVMFYKWIFRFAEYRILGSQILNHSTLPAGGRVSGGYFVS